MHRIPLWLYNQSANVQNSVMIMPINLWSHLISFLLAVDTITVFLAPSIAGVVNVLNANGEQVTFVF